MTSTRVYVLPPTTVEDPDTGEDVTRPKYMGRDDVEGYNGSLIPAPGSWPGATTSGGDVFLAGVTAEQTAHDAAQDASDVWLIGTMTGADVSPSDAAEYLNNHFRVDLSGIDDADVVRAFEELLDLLGPEYRRLSAEEWANRLGIGSGAFD